MQSPIEVTLVCDCDKDTFRASKLGCDNWTEQPNLTSSKTMEYKCSLSDCFIVFDYALR